MKKHILTILTFLFVSVVMLTGCGSSSNDGSMPIILPEKPTPGLSGYVFDNATTPIEITQSNKDYTLQVQLLKDGFIVVGETVQLKAFSALYGDVTSYSAITGTDGYANFDYISPAVLPASGPIQDPLKIIFIDENNQTITQEIVLDFQSSTGGGQYSLVKATTPVNIKYADQVETISVYVVDTLTGLGVSEKTVTISTPEFGDMTTSTTVTDGAGKAEFGYQAPSSLEGLTDTVVTLSFTENSVTVTKNVEIKVIKAPVGISEYKLINGSSPVVVSFAGEIKEISVQLVKSDGTPQSGETIIAKSIPMAFGTISVSNVITGEDGYARFSYVSADPLTDGKQPLELYYDDTESGERVFSIIDIDIKKQTVVSQPQVVIPNDKKENTLTLNNELVELAIKVFEGGTNTPYSEGKVKVELPRNVTDGVDVGSFEAYEVDIVNGVAVFKYTGPNDLQGLIDSLENESVFQFYHEDYYEGKQPVKMIYIPGSGYIPINYELIINSDDGKFTMGLLKEKTFSIILKDDQGSEVPDADITSITIISKNTLIGKLLKDGLEVDALTITGKNPVNFNIKTNTKSGLLPIEVIVEFVDANGAPNKMIQTINIVVFSGPPTAMSISYAGVSQDESRAKYIEKFAVTVVDTYNNKVNTQPNISVGGIVEYAVDGSSATGTRTTTSPRLWYGKFDTPYGSVVPIGGNQAKFDTAVGLNKFQYVDFANEKLVVFGEGYVYEALGKWDISAGTTLDSLALTDDYFGITRNNLFYAVGHNYRLDLCSSDGREYVGAAESDTYQIDVEGTALINFMYDYHLTGKDIMLWVNLTGYQADTGTTIRIGEVQKHTLRGNGLIAPDSYILPKGSGARSLYFGIRHENAPEHYRNGHFGFAVTGKCSIHNVIDSSNYNYDNSGIILSVKDARSCDNGGVVYVKLNVSNPTDSDCTIGLDNVIVSGEF